MSSKKQQTVPGEFSILAADEVEQEEAHLLWERFLIREALSVPAWEKVCFVLAQ